MKKVKLEILNMKDIAAKEVEWIWYPYIPCGKITIVQGDPGEGKTTFVLALIALLTTGMSLPEEKSSQPPINVIYQTAEDGLADTIKPRLLSLGADCSRVLVINEADNVLSLSDERLELAIKETGAKLLILDPIQAYLGGNVDMHRANEVRPVLKQIASVAEQTGCAVILIGHMNKMQGAKSSYRGLGSIDFRAAARSVLSVGRSKDNPAIRIAAHDKSSLATEGRSISFELRENYGFRWRGYCDATVDDLLAGGGSIQTKTFQAEELIREMLSNKAVPSDDLFQSGLEAGISERTIKIAKSNLGVKSFKEGNRWFSSLPNPSRG